MIDIKGIGGFTPPPKNMNFLYISYSPIFLLSKIASYFTQQTNVTFDVMIIYMNGVSSNIGKNALCIYSLEAKTSILSKDILLLCNNCVEITYSSCKSSFIHDGDISNFEV